MTAFIDRPAAPVILAFAAAALWGIWWIPIRYIEHLGMDGAWGSVAMNAGAVLFVLVFLPMQAVLIVSALWAARSRWQDETPPKDGA